MTVASPTEIGCQQCGAEPGAPCSTRAGRARKDPHAIRIADSRLEDVEAGDVPEAETAKLLDFGEAWRRRQARANGVDL